MNQTLASPSMYPVSMQGSVKTVPCDAMFVAQRSRVSSPRKCRFLLSYDSHAKASPRVLFNLRRAQRNRSLKTPRQQFALAVDRVQWLFIYRRITLHLFEAALDLDGFCRMCDAVCTFTLYSSLWVLTHGVSGPQFPRSLSSHPVDSDIQKETSQKAESACVPLAHCLGLWLVVVDGWSWDTGRG